MADVPRYLARIVGVIRSDEIGDPAAVPTEIVTPTIDVDLPTVLAAGQVADVVIRVEIRRALPG